MTITDFERHFNGYMVDLIRHLVRTEQAKPKVMAIMSEIMHKPHDETLRFYKKYKEHLDG